MKHDKMESGTDLLATIEQDSSVVLVNAEAFEAWLISLRAKVDGLDNDVSIRKNREAIREAAAEIGRKKASVERDRLRLTKEWRDMTDKVNAAGKDIKGKLEGLQEEVRKPLTEWEDAEDARIKSCEAIIASLTTAAVIMHHETADDIRSRGTHVYNTVIDVEKFGNLYEKAMGAKSQALEMLKEGLARLVKDEADRAELEKLRAENAERDRIETERREKAEQEAAEAAEVERQKAAIAAVEKAKQEREEQIARDAAEKAQRDAEMAAQAERDRIQAEHDAALAAEKKRADDLAAADARRVAEKAAADAEEARLAKNRAHGAQYMGEAKIAIMAAANAGHAVEHPITEAAAIAIVKAIVAGSIPHVALDFRA